MTHAVLLLTVGSGNGVSLWAAQQIGHIWGSLIPMVGTTCALVNNNEHTIVLI